MATDKPTFVLADYIVFALTVLSSVGIGVYFAFSGRGHNTTLNYFLGDRKLRYGPLALSLVVTFQSSIMLLGFPAEVYLFGFMIVLFNIGQCAAIFISTRIVVPLMHPLKITSVYHYLSLRFDSNASRLLTVWIGIISQCIYMGVVLFGPAIALQSVTNFPAWASIVCIASASVLYTSIGGISAVMWTDVVQFVIIMSGIIAVLVKGTLDTGGVSSVWGTNLRSRRLDIFDFNPDPSVRHTFWTVMTGSFVGTFSLTLSQSTIQRFNATPKLKDAKKVLYLAGPIFVLLQTLSMSVGLVCYAYYFHKGCDPMQSGRITNPNQIVPYMIIDIFSEYPGLPGLFISALFSASLSTLSSLLSGLSAVTVEDLIKPYFTFSDRTMTCLAKVSVIVYGALGVSVAFIISQIPGSLTQILFSLMGAATGPSVGIFLLAMFFRKASSKGVVIGGIVGLIVSFWICIGSTVSTNIPRTKPLPLPPVDMCPSLKNPLLHGNNSSFSGVNGTALKYNFSETTSPAVTFTVFNQTTHILSEKTKVPPEKKPEGVDKLYTLSYALLSTLGTVVSVLVGAVASLLTYDAKICDKYGQYTMSLSRSLCCCFSKCKTCGNHGGALDTNQTEYDALSDKMELSSHA